MSLGVSYRNHVLPISLYVVQLEVFPCTLVEQVLQILELVRNRAGQGPHGVPEADGRSLARGAIIGWSANEMDRIREGTKNPQVHGCQIAVLVDHGHRRVDLFKVNLMSASKVNHDQFSPIDSHTRTPAVLTYSSSIVS